MQGRHLFTPGERCGLRKETCEAAVFLSFSHDINTGFALVRGTSRSSLIAERGASWPGPASPSPPWTAIGNRLVPNCQTAHLYCRCAATRTAASSVLLLKSLSAPPHGRSHTLRPLLVLGLACTLLRRHLGFGAAARYGGPHELLRPHPAHRAPTDLPIPIPRPAGAEEHEQHH